MFFQQVQRLASVWYFNYRGVSRTRILHKDVAAGGVDGGSGV